MRSARFLLLAFVAAACGDDVAPPPHQDPAPAATGVALEPAVAEAIAKARAAVEATPTAATWERLGLVLHAHRMLREAEDAYGAAIAAGGGERFACHYLAGLCAADRDPERAVAHLERALALDERSAPLHLRLGALYETLDSPAEARRHFERAAALAPSSHAQLGLARASLEAGDATTAIAQLERARELAPNHREVIEALARAYHQAGRIDEARDAANAAPGAHDHPLDDPHLARVSAQGVSFSHRMRMASLHVAARDYVRGLDALDAALEARPGNPDALLSRAQVLLALKRPEDAADACAQVLAQDETNVEAQAFRGRALVASGRTAEGTALLRSVVQQAPDDIDARLALATAIKDTEPAAARGHLVHVLRRRPLSRPAQMQLANLLIAGGDFERGTRFLAEVTAKGVDDRSARAALDRALE